MTNTSIIYKIAAVINALGVLAWLLDGGDPWIVIKSVAAALCWVAGWDYLKETEQ